MRTSFLFLVLLLFSCEGDSIFDDDLVGTWQLEATRISPGGAVTEWTSVENGEIYEFYSDGSYEKRIPEVTFIGTYVFEENEILRLQSDTESDEISFYTSIIGNRMILGFIGCIEECSYRYKRLN